VTRRRPRSSGPTANCRGLPGGSCARQPRRRRRCPGRSGLYRGPATGGGARPGGAGDDAAARAAGAGTDAGADPAGRDHHRRQADEPLLADGADSPPRQTASPDRVRAPRGGARDRRRHRDGRSASWIAKPLVPAGAGQAIWKRHEQIHHRAELVPDSVHRDRVKGSGGAREDYSWWDWSTTSRRASPARAPGRRKAAGAPAAAYRPADESRCRSLLAEASRRAARRHRMRIERFGCTMTPATFQTRGAPDPRRHPQSDQEPTVITHTASAALVAACATTASASSPRRR